MASPRVGSTADVNDPATRLAQQREANEKLVLALLKETARADDAEKNWRASRQRERDLREVAEMRERLIGIVGHDLRNPLNAVLMASRMLVTSGHLPQPEAQLATSVLDSSRRMHRIIMQVLEFTRARMGGGFVLERTFTDLGAVARRIAGELHLATGCKIEVAELGDVRGSWDGELLGEALSNVAGNAVEHATPGTHVDIRVAGRGAWVFTSITNRGETIPVELRAHIFDPFRGAEVDASRRATGSLGLGLYIASEIVRAHAGRIDFESERGETTFTVVLPREPPPR